MKNLKTVLPELLHRVEELHEFNPMLGHRGCRLGVTYTEITEMQARAIFASLEQGALLHDIGKIAVADAILLKPAKLSPEEWIEMRKHPIAGNDILKRVPFLHPASAIVRHHHERFDGTGYPDALKGAQIPLGARLFTVADTLDAMTSDRTYRKGPGFDAARTEIHRYSGKQFDPHIVERFLRIPPATWIQVREEAANSSVADK